MFKKHAAIKYGFEFPSLITACEYFHFSLRKKKQLAKHCKV